MSKARSARGSLFRRFAERALPCSMYARRRFIGGLGGIEVTEERHGRGRRWQPGATNDNRRSRSRHHEVGGRGGEVRFPTRFA